MIFHSAAPSSTRVPLPLLGGLVLCVVLFGFSPLGALCIAWVFLLAGRPLTTSTTAVLLIGAVLSMATVYGSREIGPSPFDDFWNIYYPAYREAETTDFLTYVFAPFVDFKLSSLEVVLHWTLAVIALLPGAFSPNALVFIVTLCIGGLYAWWLLRYFLPTLPEQHQASAALLCIVFFSFGLCSQTTRQMLSIPLLLAAIWERRLGHSTALAVLASACHLSAAAVWVVNLAFRFFGFKALWLGVLPLLYLLQQGAGLAESLSGLDPGAIDKLLYYTENNLDAEGFDGTFVPLIALVAVSSFFILRYRRGELSALLLFFCILFFALLPLPLASFRATLFISTALLAPLACLIMTPRLSPSVFAAATAVLTSGMLGRRIFAVEEGSGMALWHLFGPVVTLPFEYVLRIHAGN